MSIREWGRRRSATIFSVGHGTVGRFCRFSGINLCPVPLSLPPLSFSLARSTDARHLFCPPLPLSLLLPRGLSRCPMVDCLLLKGKKGVGVCNRQHSDRGTRPPFTRPVVAGNDTWSVDIARGRGGGEGSAVRSASGARGRTRQRREHRNIGRIWHGSSRDFFSPVRD